MNASACPAFEGVLFFPVTPFTEAGEVDLDALARHISSGVDAGTGGVFIACGTGEFHALELQEFGPIVRTAVEVVPQGDVGGMACADLLGGTEQRADDRISVFDAGLSRRQTDD